MRHSTVEPRRPRSRVASTGRVAGWGGGSPGEDGHRPVRGPAMYQSHRGDVAPKEQRVLCIAAHPDDEVLGVGGTLARHAAEGAEVLVLIMSEGEAAKAPHSRRNAARRDNAAAAARVLGVHRLVMGELADQAFDAHPFIELIHPIEALLREFRPHIVYTHHGGDANTDHQLVFKATYAACRPLSTLSASVEQLLCYEVPSSTEQAPALPHYAFLPNVYVDVSAVWATKLAALRCYAAELGTWPHTRSIEYIDALAVKRGGEAGLRRAEAFTLIRARVGPSPPAAPDAPPGSADPTLRS
ncbi:MAG: PIG-L family deacetylase [Deltaproteobacteria bacterium]|nr:MAG: PIG-L family deacetylase [Deltaproteobacteria bacterium]